MRRVVDWGLGVLLGLICVFAVFPEAIIEGRSVVASAPLRDDPAYVGGFLGEEYREVWDSSAVLVHYPADLLAARELRQGRLPLWNPYVGAGMPLLAEAHSAPLSPFLLPFLVAPSQGTYSWFMLLRLVVASAGAFWFARSLGQGRAAAVVVAVTYTFGGCAMVRFDLPTEGTAYAMLPFCALAADVALRGERRGSFFLAVAVAVTIFASHPELAAFASLGGPLIVLAIRWREQRAPGGISRLGRGVALGVALAALVVLPFLTYVLGDGHSYKLEAKEASLFANELLYFVQAPDLARIGAGPLVLAAVALLRGASGEGRAAAWTLALVAGLFLVHLLAPPPLCWLVPPKYSIFLFVFSVALLAGAGLERLDRRTLAPATAAAAVVWLGCDLLTRGELHRLGDVVRGDMTALATVVVATLFPRTRFLVPVVLAGTFFLSARRTGGNGGDGIPETETVADVRYLAHGRSPPPRIVGTGTALRPNTASLWGAADLRAVAALFPRRYRGYMSLVEGSDLQATSIMLEAADSPLLHLAGVSTVITPSGFLRNPKAMPRAFVPSTLRSAEGPEDSLQQLATIQDRLQTVAVVEAPSTEILALQGGRGSASVTGYAPHRVEIQVTTESAGLVVLTDAFDPGWRATVNDAPAPVYATNHLFRGVPVPAGQSRIVMHYEPTSVAVAKVTSVVALLLLLWSLVGRRRDSHFAR